MRAKKALSTFHFAGLAFFIASGIYLWFSFDPANLQRSRFIKVLAADSVFISVVTAGLCAIALFALLLRRKARSIEHPLTSSNIYRYFYYLSPFIGAAAGAVVVIGINGTGGLLVIATGSALITSAVWLIIDPAVTILELFGPNSIRLRRARARISKSRIQRRKSHKLQLIEEARLQNMSVQADWQHALEPYANELAALVTDTSGSEAHRRARAIDIALHASKMGGRQCMQHLYHMARRACREKTQDDWIAHNISVWWDGVGGWRNERPVRTH